MKTPLNKIRNVYGKVREKVKSCTKVALLASSFLFPSLGDAYAAPPNDRNYIGIPGINQDWNAWSDLEKAIDNQDIGIEMIGINLPNQGHNGWEQNKAAIESEIKSTKGKINGIFGYSLGGVSALRYMEENPDFLEKNKGGTLMLVDPAVKSNLGEALTSEPLRRIAPIYQKRLSLTKTELELTGRDPDIFLEKTHRGLETLAENLVKNDWKVEIIKLNSAIVDGKAISDVAEQLSKNGAKVNVYTPDQVRNEYSLPTIGNQGIFSGGKDTLRQEVIEHLINKSFHAWWAPSFKGAIVNFIKEKLLPQQNQEFIVEYNKKSKQPYLTEETKSAPEEKGRELEDPRKYDVDTEDEEYKDDKKDYRRPNNGKEGQGNIVLKHREERYGGIDLRNPDFTYISEDKSSKQPSKPIRHSDYGGIILSNLELCYLTERSLGNDHYLGYALKAKSRKKGSIDIENSSKLSLEALLNWITLPDEIFWVNLNPQEPYRIVDYRLRETDIGEILLKADLQLKKKFAELTDPRSSTLGKTFWESIKLASKNVNQTEAEKSIQMSNRLWIVPGKVDVYVNDHEIYIQDAKLDVMLESEYLSSKELKEREKETGKNAKDIMKKMILPKIINSVNNDEAFEELRQIFYARILAKWYEERSSYRLLQGDQVIRGKTWDPKKIFENYVWSYKEGEYSFWETKNEQNLWSGTIVHSTHYFMGGVDFIRLGYNILGTKIPQKKNLPSSELPPDITRKFFGAILDPFGSQEGNEFHFGGFLTLEEK